MTDRKAMMYIVLTKQIHDNIIIENLINICTYEVFQYIVLENFIHKVYTQLLFQFDYKYAMNAFHH